MNDGRCFYHAINRNDCGYTVESAKNSKLLPKLFSLLEDMTFEHDIHVKTFAKTGHQSFVKSLNPYFRIEIYINDDSPKIKGHTIWMIVEKSMSIDTIIELIYQMAIFGDYYRAKLSGK